MNIRGTTRTAALTAVGSLSLLAPLGAAAAHAAVPGYQTFSGVAYVNATCGGGGQPLFALNNLDHAQGTIELIYSNPSYYGHVRVPGVGQTDTNGPKTPFNMTAITTEPLLACVEVPGMTAVVRWTVERPPFWRTIAVSSTAREAALP